MPKLGVTLLAGFLGSGKTTLVNRLLADPAGKPYAVLVNEFGDVGIDGRLVVAAEEDLVELANGCVCCTVRGDLERGLLGLLERRGRILGRARFEGVLIEASGLASPGPIAQTLAIVPALAEAFELQGIVTLAHAARVAAQLTEFPEASDQVGYADWIVLNHVDRCDAAELEAAEAALRAVNGTADIVRAERAVVDLARFREPAASAASPRLLASAAGDGLQHRHTSDVTTLALSSDIAIDIHRLKMWLRFLSSRPDGEILRLKGIVRLANQARPLVVQAVYQWLEISPGEGPSPERSELVLIGRGFDAAELERGWRACWAQED